MDCGWASSRLLDLGVLLPTGSSQCAHGCTDFYSVILACDVDCGFTTIQINGGTQAFLTGTLQNYARRNQVAIDTISYGFKVLQTKKEDITEQPESGCIIYGLFLEGAVRLVAFRDIFCTLESRIKTMLEIHVVHEQSDIFTYIFSDVLFHIMIARAEGLTDTNGAGSPFVGQALHGMKKTCCWRSPRQKSSSSHFPSSGLNRQLCA